MTPKIDRNMLAYYLRNNSFGRKNIPLSSSASRKNDTVQISCRSEKDMINAEIERQIIGGEPMNGISYGDFRNYCYDNGLSNNYKIEQAYKQALKGDNASLAGKEWRTDPLYSIPPRLYSSPEVTADREAALEKYRSGGDLSKWESQLLRTFPNGFEGSKTVAEAGWERSVNIMQGRLSKALSDEGLELDENAEIHLEVWGGSVKISGNIDAEQLEKVQQAFDNIDVSKTEYKNLGYNLQGIYYRHHHDFALEGGFALGFLQKAEETLLEKTGGKVTVFDLSLDKDGNVLGLPDDMDKYLRENATGAFGSGIDAEGSKYQTIKDARYLKESFVSSIKAVQKGDYDRLRAMTCHITFKNGKLEF